MTALALAFLAAALPDDASVPAGEPVLEPSTLHCLGVYWIVRGDANRNAAVAVDVRKAAAAEWRKGPPLFRVEKGASRLPVPADAWLFAGSVVELEPATAYELRLTLADPDGGGAEKVLPARTIAEPEAPDGLATVHVRPGPGALRAAAASAKPGTLFLLHAGTYAETLEVRASGEPGRPIVWRGAGDGEAVIDAGGEGNAVTAAGVHDVWFEDLTVRRAKKGLSAGNSSRIVVRRCRFLEVEYGVFCTVNERGDVHGFFVSDSVFEGPSTWPRTKGIENARAVQVTGAGHVVCHNRLRGFADAIDTMPSASVAAIDFHHNEVSEMTDDGIETDYSDRNVRCFSNRLTNVYQGISAQPVHGGPVYIFRNAIYNVAVEPFKLHNSPSGVILYHNTTVRRGAPLVVMTPAKVRNSVSRNNLFVGSGGGGAALLECPMVDCDFDYDGFAGGGGDLFLKWNGARYASVEEARSKAPAYRHAVALSPDGLFAGEWSVPQDPRRQHPVGADLRPRPGTAAIDAGTFLPGFNDGFAGSAPDLGAFEAGAPLPPYGPRPRK